MDLNEYRLWTIITKLERNSEGKDTGRDLAYSIFRDRAAADLSVELLRHFRESDGPYTIKEVEGPLSKVLELFPFA